MTGLLLIADAVFFAVLFNYFLKRLARLTAFRWLERLLSLSDPIPIRYRHVFVYLGALIMFVVTDAFLR